MSVTHSATPRIFANLTDVTLADEDNNSIPTDGAKRVIPGNDVAMQVLRWRHLVANFVTSASGAIDDLVTKFLINASGLIWWLNV